MQSQGYYPAQGQYPPPQGQYPPSQGQYPPPQGQYPPPQGQYPPPHGQYPNPGQPQYGPTPQLVAAQPTPQVVVAASGSLVYATYRVKQSLVVGSIQVAVGILSVTCNIAGVAIHNAILAQDTFLSSNNISYYSGYGIWCSFFYIIAGAYGIRAAKTRTRCPVVATLVLSILAAIIVWCHIGLAFASVISDANPVTFRISGFDLQTVDVQPWQSRLFKVSLLFSSIMLIASLVELVASIFASCLGCQVTCCGPPMQLQGAQTQTQVIYTPNVVAAPQPQAAPQAGYAPYAPATNYPQQPAQAPGYIDHPPPAASAPPPAYGECEKPPIY